MASGPRSDRAPRLEVVRPGVETTIQEWPGRIGLWSVGVPASGPMDELSFRLGNRALGNDEGAPGLEVTMGDLALRFPTAAMIMVTGAPAPVMINSQPVAQWQPVFVVAGSLVELGSPGAGTHSYLLIMGGVAAPAVLGSVATFTRGELSGLAGRPLRAGDVVPLHPVDHRSRVATGVPAEQRPEFDRTWRLGVLEGPHGAPDFLTRADADAFYDGTWTVHPQSSRTGIRLVGPLPTWGRRDGGDAGLHPSAIHDTPYAAGAVTYPGDRPVILGPDGPTLGRSVCPATVVSAHRWKLGQLRPGDTVRFVPVADLQADDLRRQPPRGFAAGREPVVDGGVLLRRAATPDRPRVTFRRQGDDYLLVEYGEMTLDIGLRVRVQALADAVAQQAASGGLVGVVDLTPGIRSLQLHVDPAQVRVTELLGVVRALDDALAPTRELVVPSRTVRLPLCWADPAVAEAVTRHRAEVRDDAPWCPGNLDFIRRLNGLDSVDDVVRTVFAAQHLVLALGIGHFGAPVATAIDPRHRLLGIACDPARTWTPAGAGASTGPISGSTPTRVRAPTICWAVRCRSGRGSTARAGRPCCAASTGSAGTRSPPRS